MNNNVIDELIELEVFSYKSLSEEEYNDLKDKSDESFIYQEGKFNLGNGQYSKWYKEINTHGLSENDIMLELAIMRTKTTKSIKSMVSFFVVLTVISMIISAISTLISLG